MLTVKIISTNGDRSIYECDSTRHTLSGNTLELYTNEDSIAVSILPGHIVYVTNSFGVTVDRYSYFEHSSVKPPSES